MDYNHNGKIDKEDLIIEEEMNQPHNTINGKDAIKGSIPVSIPSFIIPVRTYSPVFSQKKVIKSLSFLIRILPPS